MDIISKLNLRYATKIFDPLKKVSDSDMQKLLEAIRLSASSFGLQPYKILVVRDTKIRTELRRAARDQSQITDAAALLVFAVKFEANSKTVDQYVDLVAHTRHLSKDSLAGFADRTKQTLQKMTPDTLDTWVSKQAYIALGFGLVSAAVLGIDSCPMEGFNASEFDRILDINKRGLKSKVLLAVGYRSSEDGYQYVDKVRLKKEDLFIKY